MMQLLPLGSQEGGLQETAVLFIPGLSGSVKSVEIAGSCVLLTYVRSVPKPVYTNAL
jgi:hypothetical protein